MVVWLGSQNPVDDAEQFPRFAEHGHYLLVREITLAIGNVDLGFHLGQGVARLGQYLGEGFDGGMRFHGISQQRCCDLP